MNTLEDHKTLLATQQINYEALLPLCYSFDYNGLPFECQLVRRDDDSTFMLHLTALLGHLPYSAENKPRRERLRTRLGPLMSQGKVTTDRHSKITFPLKTVISGDISANVIIEAILYTLLDAREILSAINDSLEMPEATEVLKQTA